MRRIDSHPAALVSIWIWRRIEDEMWRGIGEKEHWEKKKGENKEKEEGKRVLFSHVRKFIELLRI